ncbi:MAG TPA: methylmalonyl-CoA epimerase [Bacteroidia bacterium]|jgi:methylmalonyl-CoA/ethylmalonyl-CoA epimerase|nr:methylmalonyl-CoA epimerase [Bacteroidia bacterium]
MIKKIEHIGIAVKNIETANAVYTKLLGTSAYKSENVESEGVITSFFKVGESKIELLEGTSANSPISKFIDKKGEGMHHIAFEVDDIEKEMENLRNQGFALLSDKPKPGADNKLICFVHPKSANGVLIELCQEIKK